MPSTLLAVKFYIPKPRPFLTERAALLDRFTAGLTCPLTLISAPAGFGKSTLLSAWFDRQVAGENQASRPDVFGWLSLDGADNHGARFWLYVVAAIQAGLQKKQVESGSVPGISLDPLLEFLQSQPPPSIQPVLDQLINAITAGPERILLVLDDYHVIQTPEIHEQVTYLLEHQPPNLHLVLSTRVDPPLPIARMRARGQLSEFRAANLRFSSTEAEGFFRNITGFDVSREDLSVIQDSTEGWIAGLQMAALALQAVLTGAPDNDSEARQGKIKAFIHSFSGKHLFIIDYLTDEVFNRQPEAIQAFLLKTSILERMSAGLCDGLLQADEDNVASQEKHLAARTTGAARAILDYLEKSNLFLIRLDAERQWFRYHHLFADLLRARLEQTWPEIIPELHRRASRWYEQNGFIDEAIQHAIAYAAAAQDWDWAAKLMELHVVAYLERGQLAAVLKWIDSLPQAVLRGRPVLCTQVAWALAHAGQFQRVPPLVEMTETALAARDAENQATVASPLTGQELTRVRGIVTALRAFGSIMTGKPDQAVELASHGLETLPDLELREQAWLNWMCGYACRSMGRLDQAIHFFENALEISRQANTVWEDMSTDLGIAYRFRGKLAKAIEVFQDVLLRAEKLGMRNKGNLSRVEAFLSAVLLDQNRLEEALEHAQKGVYYLQWWPSHNHITTAYLYLGQVWLGIGKLSEAAEAIQRAEQEQHKGQVMPTVLRLVEYTSIRLWLQQGDWNRLEKWLSTQETALPDLSSETRLFNEYEEMRLVSVARVWIAKGRKDAAPAWFERAFAILEPLEILAKRSQWVHALIEIHLLQAVALRELSKTAVASPGDPLVALTRSLALGLPEGYAWVYLQEGPVLAEMLQTWLRSSAPRSVGTGLNPVMVKKLLDQFGVTLLGDNGDSGSRFTGGKIIEPLTEREQEVLRLLAFGLSNKEMAERLVVSEGTIKTHVHNLIGKLGAQSRTHVLARAKELNIL